MNIQKIAQTTGLSAHTLRYYEKIGLLLDIKRDRKGHRFYRDKDLIWIQFIQRLKATNMPLVEMKQFAMLRLKGDKSIPERVSLLERHESRIQVQMAELKAHRARVREKIALCKEGANST
ncbi:MAG: MerR family transcriptional regulator [Pseudomonadota bacterium]